MRIGLYIGDLHGQSLFRTLQGLGVTTVFGSPSTKAAAVASKEGLEYFCVDWTFRLPRPGNRRMLLRDYSGEERRWAGGSSGCPSSPQLVDTAARRVTHALRLAEKRFDGLMLDGIRFSSFTEELTTFLTCFCPNCAREAVITESISGASKTRYPSS